MNNVYDTSNKMYDPLPMDEQCEEGMIYLVGDSILNQFYNGNWSATVDLMTKELHSIDHLIEYLHNERDEDSEFEGEPYGGFFDNAFFAELGASTVKLN